MGWKQSMIREKLFYEKNWCSIKATKCFLQVPQDRTVIKKVLRTVSLPLFVCMSSVACCGIIIALGLIIFNIIHKHRRYAEQSFEKSPCEKLLILIFQSNSNVTSCLQHDHAYWSNYLPDFGYSPWD